MVVKNYINNNREGLFSKIIVGGMCAVTIVAAVLFDDVTPATLLFF